MLIYKDLSISVRYVIIQITIRMLKDDLKNKRIHNVELHTMPYANEYWCQLNNFLENNLRRSVLSIKIKNHR